MTQEQLLRIRWKKACDTGRRYVIVGNGLRRLVTEYFPLTMPLSNESLLMINTSNCSFRAALSKGQFNMGVSTSVKLVVMVASMTSWRLCEMSL